jgi:hypothetical protein
MTFTAGTVSGDPNGVQVVAIHDVDPVKRTAVGWTRRNSKVTIDLSYFVGAALVTPAVGEQWLVVQDYFLNYRLVAKVPYNTPEPLVAAEPGMIQVGGQGPLVLSGTQITATAPIRPPTYAAADRPAATDYPVGSMIFDSTLSKALFATPDGWVDALGTAV